MKEVNCCLQIKVGLLSLGYVHLPTLADATLGCSAATCGSHPVLPALEFHKNTCREHQGAGSFLLVCNGCIAMPQLASLHDGYGVFSTVVSAF